MLLKYAKYMVIDSITNPLESNGNISRRTWFNPPCCPTNIVRFIPETGGAIYGVKDNHIYVNQFIGSKVTIALDDNEIKLVQKTDYPWNGLITLEIEPEKPVDLILHIRVPGWARGELIPGGFYYYIDDEKLPDRKVILKVNGRKIHKLNLERGYAVIERKCKQGDVVEMELPLNIRLVAGNPKIEDTRGKAVLIRGPMVYCLEEADNARYFVDNRNS